MHSPSLHLYIAFAMALLALALLLVGASWLLLAWRQARSSRNMEHLLSQRTGHTEQTMPTRENAAAPPFGQTLETMVRLGSQWMAGRFGMVLMAEEDRDLVDKAGYRDARRARALFLVARVALAALCIVAAILGRSAWPSGSLVAHPALLGLLGFGVGWMLPKWIVRRRVARRLANAREELPLFIDLLRLLQGVGLSVDQSLHIIVDEFHEVMPVLAQEVGWSLERYARGRSREQSLARLSNHFDNEDLAAICRLLCQVDEHGGAVQEPLAHFSERLRDQRKLDLKAQIGKLTVKMTGVMVLTLLPALLIITGGSGFVAILRGLSQISS